VTRLTAEGEWRESGDVLRVEGSARALLTAERTALNFLCHLSGVASLTRRFVDAASLVNPATRIWDTRKTLPGLRALEKAAVRAGGGVNHRGSLSDFVMVKDNHLAGLTIGEAVAAALARWPARAVEVECDRLEQVEAALAAGATIVLLDNMDTATVRDAVARVAGRAVVEVAGGERLERVRELAEAGVDVISAGALTTRAPWIDLALDLEV
jgi:nicotinate-nucleotide pyrophosphorylase (carboxylating)